MVQLPEPAQDECFAHADVFVWEQWPQNGCSQPPANMQWCAPYMGRCISLVR